MNKLVRRIETWNYLESFLVAAVLAVLFIRLFLKCTHYPQLGGARFHIAHMLWGSLLMMVAIVAFFSFAGRKILKFASVVGGLGFGTFIDEIGKFLTHDNNYFFQPSIALIYIIFVLIFFAVRALFHNKAFSQQEYLVSAFGLAGEMVNNDLDVEEKAKLLACLRECDPADPLVKAISGMIDRVAFRPHQEYYWISKTKAFFLEHYKKMASSAGFGTGVIIFFLAELIINLVTMVAPVLFSEGGLKSMALASVRGHLAMEFGRVSFLGWAQFISSWFFAFFVFAGMLKIRKKRLDAFIMLEHAILISILLTQFFAFYREQLGALTGLLLNLVVWVSLRNVIAIEKLKEQKIPVGFDTDTGAT